MAGESLWEFFHHRDDRLADANGRTIVPVLVFDQFEELFTLGAAAGAQRDRAVAFMSELAELVENRPSEKLVERLDRSSDEMDAFDFSRTDYRVCISLREDYLPHLEGLKTIMPALMENRMRLTRMTGSQALDAVIKPGGDLVMPEVARAIVEFVSGARGGSVERLAEVDVEPPLLSVICHELNERRRALGQSQITADLVSGNRREILHDFYERSVADVPAEMRAFVEDHLLTKSGYRDNLALETALEFPGVTKPLIDLLVSRRLLRLEDRLGVQRVELTHDVLAEVIRASRDAHHQTLALAQARERERRAHRRMWILGGVAAGLLVLFAGASWAAWRAVRAEHEQNRLRANEAALRQQAQAHELAARRQAYASDLRALQVALDLNNLGHARELLYRHRPKPGEVDLRGWEWRYFWQFCQSDARETVREPDGKGVYALSVAPDGNWIAMNAEGGVAIVNRQTNERMLVPTAGNVKLAHSPREPLLAIYGRKDDLDSEPTPANTPTVLLWDLVKRIAVRELPLEGWCGGLSFAENGATLAVLEWKKAGQAVSVWRVADGANLARWPLGPNQGYWFAAMATSRDLSLIARVSTRNNVAVIDLKTGRERWSETASDEEITSLAFSPDGTLLASGGAYTDPMIRLWDVASGHEIGRLAGHRSMVSRLVFLRGGTQLLSSSGDQTIRIWDVASRALLRTLRGHKTEIWSLAVLADERTAISASTDGAVHIWDLDADRAASAAGIIPGAAAGWTFFDRGQSIITADRQGHLVRWRGRNFQERTPVLDVGKIESVIFAAHHPLMAVTADTDVKVWDWEKRKVVREFPAIRGSPPEGAKHFTNDGTKIWIRTANVVREVELATGKESRAVEIPADPNRPGRVLFPPNENRLYVVRGARATTEWLEFDLHQGRMTSFTIYTGGGATPAFSGDGKLMAVGFILGSARLFDVRSHQPVATFSGFMHGVHAVEFSPDSDRLVTGGTAIEALTLWDVHSYERLLTFNLKVDILAPTAFSPDGNIVAGLNAQGSGAGSLNFWRAPAWAEIEAAERQMAAKVAAPAPPTEAVILTPAQQKPSAGPVTTLSVP